MKSTFSRNVNISVQKFGFCTRSLRRLPLNLPEGREIFRTGTFRSRLGSKRARFSAMGKWPAAGAPKCAAAHLDAVADFLARARARTKRARVYKMYGSSSGATRMPYKIRHRHVRRGSSHTYARARVAGRADYTVGRCEKYYPLISEVSSARAVSLRQEINDRGLAAVSNTKRRARLSVI